MKVLIISENKLKNLQFYKSGSSKTGHLQPHCSRKWSQAKRIRKKKEKKKEKKKKKPYKKEKKKKEKETLPKKKKLTKKNK